MPKISAHGGPTYSGNPDVDYADADALEHAAASVRSDTDDAKDEPKASSGTPRSTDGADDTSRVSSSASVTASDSGSSQARGSRGR
jgi:hypothetical protein